ncbi:MAG: DNA-binding transcriptional regulator OxyR [Cellvibrionales bacterium]|nr:DNA-binding transcriptional regulator OxyR [Cellvibrionales bacterium]
MIKLKDLQYLIAVDDFKHFGQAANACHVSQPTLSGQIKKLEEQLDLQLIERHNKGVMLTAAGEALIQQARDILQKVNQFEQSAQALHDPFAGDLHVGLIPTLAPYLLPKIMGELNQQLPDIDFYLHEDKTHILLERLHKGEVDCLILPYMDTMKTLDCFDLFKEPLTLAVSKDHQLASKAVVNFDDLKGQEILALEDGHCLREQTMGYCFAAGAEENQQFRASSLETLRFMVSVNTGITVMPELAAKADHSANLCYIPFDESAPKRRIVLVVRSNTSRFPLMRKMVSLIKTIFN